MRKYFLIGLGCVCFFYGQAQLLPARSGRGSGPAEEAGPLHHAQKALTAVIVHDIFSPPVASRIYVYANIAAYEVLVQAEGGNVKDGKGAKDGKDGKGGKDIKDGKDGAAGLYRSLYGQIASFPAIPAPRKKIKASMAAVYAYLLVGRKLVFSEAVLEDSMQNILRSFPEYAKDKILSEASLQYGQEVADTILRWVGRDQYRETRKLPRYRLIKQDGRWIPTPPAYMAAIEPYWNRIRPITLDSASQFRPVVALTYSRDTSSPFYKQAYDVYQAGNKLTDRERAMANFWDCNPFAVSTEGHLNFAVKKISPGGHWISIVGVVTRQQKLSIMAASAVYTYTAIALFDAFISCWDEKYRSNVIRPETYINAGIDESWRPLLQTPPFPEYISGHSVISSAAAFVLTDLLGDHHAFEDDTEVEFGLPVRHFDSFYQAAEEAGLSRFYGGIHYRVAIEQGQVQGMRVGQHVVKRIRLTER